MESPCTEEDIQVALFAITNGMSQRRAASEYGIPRATLQRRINGGISRQEAREPQQRLSPIQEDHLTQWVLTQESLGHPPTHTQIRLFAGKILHAKGDGQPLGRRWMEGFLRRNPILRTKKQLQIESVRVNGATTEVIKKWFQNMALPYIKSVKPENRWNMDEAGIMEGIGDNGLVVGSAERRFIQKKTPGSKAWTSFIECISALGQSVSPLVIFKGKTVQQQWYETELHRYKGWKFTATENGWTSDDTAVEWLQKIFIPKTAPRDPSEVRLLVLDGHGSHETDDFMWECYSNNIQLLFLPPHTSHVLQPLDLAVFSPLKTYYRKQIGFLSLLTDSTPIGKRNFLICYAKARKQALTSQNIKSGWRAGGLWPVNSAKPLMSRLLLDNSNKPNSKASKRKAEEPLLDWSIQHSAFRIKTPKKMEDVRDEVYQISQLGKASAPTARVLFRKVSKAFDQREFVIAQHEQRIKQLEARVLQLEPRKRRKVRVSPNSKFVGIEAIRQAQIEAGDRHIELQDTSTVEELSSTLSHITIS